MGSTCLITGNVLPPSGGTNKGTVLLAGSYLGVGDYLFRASQWYGFYAILQPNGDLRFYYSQAGMPSGDFSYIDRNQPYYSLVCDAGSVHVDPSWQFNPSQNNGQYFAIMQADGNFVIYRGTGPSDNKGPCWATNTWQHGPGPSYFAVLAPDGNLQVGSAPSGTTPANGLNPADITWQSALTYPANRIIGGTAMQAGQWMPQNSQLRSDNWAYGLNLAATGALTLFCGIPPGSNIESSQQQYWSNNVARAADPCFVIMQSDGNFCIYQGTDPGHNLGLYWAISGAARPEGSYVATLRNDGTLAVYAGSDPNSIAAPLWTNAAPADPGAYAMRIISGNNQQLTGGGNTWAPGAPLVAQLVKVNGVPCADETVYFSVYPPNSGMMTFYPDSPDAPQNQGTFPTDDKGMTTTAPPYLFIYGEAGMVYDIRAAPGSYDGTPYVDFNLNTYGDGS
jgi:hypothetical protein